MCMCMYLRGEEVDFSLRGAEPVLRAHRAISQGRDLRLQRRHLLPKRRGGHRGRLARVQLAGELRHQAACERLGEGHGAEAAHAPEVCGASMRGGVLAHRIGMRHGPRNTPRLRRAAGRWAICAGLWSCGSWQLRRRRWQVLPIVPVDTSCGQRRHRPSGRQRLMLIVIGLGSKRQIRIGGPYLCLNELLRRPADWRRADDVEPDAGDQLA